MDFDKDKKECLDKLYLPDKSKKGDVDDAIIDLIDYINKTEDYYTTSSCAGRIVLIAVPKIRKKHEAEWLFVSHDPITIDNIKEIITNPPELKLWFKQESPIFHIACRTIETAQDIVDKAKYIGFKRAGIMCSRKRIIVEMCGTESMETIIAEDKTLLCSEEYIEKLIQEANTKMATSRDKMDAFHRLLAN
jgi:tRNA wybutosine-synthesizing protein 3